MNLIRELLSRLELDPAAIQIIARVMGIVLMLALALLSHLIAKRFLLRLIKGLTERTKTLWDDILLRRRVFNRLAHLAPALVIYLMTPWVGEVNQLAEGQPVPALVPMVQRIAVIYMAVIGLLVVDSFLNAVVDIYNTYDIARKRPIRGFVQGFKIILYFIAGIVLLSIVVGKSPTILLGGLGAMTAVLMLIFKDSILGLVAGFQLSMNQMLHIGDWIEMPKYGADGDVIDITLTTVKVRNWDKTISTIPAYALISDSFKNWRGMSESGGRRIKRSVNIDMTSIRFCTQTMLDRFKRIQYISDYIEHKLQEIREHNKGIDETDLINWRQLTNIGTFRAYVAAYLRHHPKIHQNMTFLVRHLQPTEKGLPVEIYVFSNDQVWANYESIQADIFDHILAVIPQFELRVFQNPAGADFQHLLGTQPKG